MSDEASAPIATEQKRRRVFLVDDHAVVRDGLSELLNQARDLEVCGEAASAGEALQKIDSARADIAIVDLTLGEVSGLGLLKNLKARYPPFPCWSCRCTTSPTTPSAASGRARKATS